MFSDIIKRNNAFLGHKNKKFKKSKNEHFFRGVSPMVLVQNWPFFHRFVFRQYRPGKCVI